MFANMFGLKCLVYEPTSEHKSVQFGAAIVRLFQSTSTFKKIEQVFCLNILNKNRNLLQIVPFFALANHNYVSYIFISVWGERGSERKEGGLDKNPIYLLGIY